MNEQVNHCPKCHNYIFGTYCYTCDSDIRLVINPFEDIFGDIFKEEEDNNA